jgi:hypothetical protein
VKIRHFAGGSDEFLNFRGIYIFFVAAFGKKEVYFKTWEGLGCREQPRPPGTPSFEGFYFRLSPKGIATTGGLSI